MKNILFKIKNYLLYKENKILLIILGFLGFTSSCIPVAEYGVPSADYILNGNIKSSTTNTAIDHIQVIMNYDTSYTDASGNFSVTSNDFPDDITYDVYFNDIDSTENGSYTNKQISVQFYSADLTDGDGSWYEGSTSKNIDVKLDPKTK